MLTLPVREDAGLTAPAPAPAAMLVRLIVPAALRRSAICLASGSDSVPTVAPLAGVVEGPARTALAPAAEGLMAPVRETCGSLSGSTSYVFTPTCRTVLRPRGSAGAGGCGGRNEADDDGPGAAANEDWAAAAFAAAADAVDTDVDVYEVGDEDVSGTAFEAGLVLAEVVEPFAWLTEDRRL